MNKENASAWRARATEEETLTPEQRARISLNFRAAKALLSRKKPRLSSPSPKALATLDGGRSCPVRMQERIPLNDLQLNAVSQSAARSCNKKDGKYVMTSPLMCNSVGRISDRAAMRGCNGYCKDESFITPISTRGRLFDPSDANQGFNVPSILDDEFDNSILEEIDSLCAASASKSLPGEVNSGPDFTLKAKTNDDSVSSVKLFSHEELENPTGDLKDSSPPQMRHINAAHAQDFRDMPEAYSKYMESLNEDQLEAASTDASRPLMVVAGPGSGKVILNPLVMLVGPLVFLF